MQQQETKNWKQFKEALLLHPTSDLQFQYAENKWVDASYHITEIKQAPVTSVDCGGVMNTWTEVIIQLWEPERCDSERAMKVGKALSIIEQVEKSLPLNPLGIIKIEFGNKEFGTRQMFPNEISLNGNNLIIDLRPDAVQCKALGRGGSCGTTEKARQCCTPTIDNPKKQPITLVTSDETCTPGSSCC